MLSVGVGVGGGGGRFCCRFAVSVSAGICNVVFGFVITV